MNSLVIEKHTPAAEDDWTRIAVGVALAATSGVLSSLAFPPYGVWPLIFVAFVPMAYAQHRLLPVAFAPLAPGIALGIYFAGQLSFGLAQGRVPLVFQLWPVYVAVCISLLGWPGRNFHAETGYRWLPVLFPTLWVGIDAARALSGVDFLGGTWGNPSYALFSQAWLLQPLSIFGIYGLEFLLLVVNYALSASLMALGDAYFPPRGVPAISTRQAAVTLAAALGALAAWISLSLLLFGSAPGTLRVGTVQANVARDHELEFRRMMSSTRSLAREGARLVVWREGGLRFDPKVTHTAELRALARETNTFIAMGYGIHDTAGLRHNEALVLSPDGTFYGPYGKSHPGRFAGDQSDTGGVYKVYDTAIGHIATIICYDLDFTDTARAMALRGATFVAVPSNDVPAIASTHYTHLVFRAIENRIGLAKSDSMFDTAIIDPYGRILASNVNQLSFDDARRLATDGSLPAKTLIANVPVLEGGSFYTRFGDWFGWLAMLASFSILAAQVLVRYEQFRSK